MFVDNRRKEYFMNNMEIKSCFLIKKMVLFKKVKKFFDEYDQLNKIIYIFVGINDLIIQQRVYNNEELIVYFKRSFI